MEARTEYAVRGSVYRYGKWSVETVRTERPWKHHSVAQAWADDMNERLQSAGRQPDAVVLERTITVSDWAPERTQP